MEEVDAAVAVEVIGHDAHAAVAWPSPSYAGPYRRPPRTAGPPGFGRDGWEGVIGHEDIELAVVVKVDDGDAEAGTVGTSIPAPHRRR